MEALVVGLESEFGRGGGEALAQRFLEAEEIAFHWDARDQERWFGTYESAGDEDFELDRVAIVGRLDGQWFVAMMIVDGDGNAHGMMGTRIFRGQAQAQQEIDTRRRRRASGSGAQSSVALIFCPGSL